MNNTEATPQKKIKLRAWRTIFLLSFLLCGIVLFVLFQPPVSWKEIYFLATLKQQTVTGQVSLGPDFKTSGIEGLHMSWAFHDPPWLLDFLSLLLRLLRSFFPSDCGVSMGGCARIALRLTALLPAAVSFLFLTFSLRHRASSRAVFQSEEQNTDTATPIFHVAALVTLASLGALEHLFIVCSLTMLHYMTSQPVRPKQQLFTSLILISVSGLLATSGSQLWITALLAAGLILGQLRSGSQKSAVRRHVMGCAFLSAFFFVGLFFLSSNSLNLVHHFTLRWLNNIQLRDIDTGWSGSSLLWKGVALWLMSLSLRELARSARTRKITSPQKLFLHLLVSISGVLLCFACKNPLIEDIVLQLFLSILSFGTAFRNEDETAIKTIPQKNSRAFEIFVAALRFTPQLIGWGLAFAGLVALLLTLAPNTTTVPELKAWASALAELVAARPMPFLLALIFIIAVCAVSVVRPLSVTLNKRVFAANICLVLLLIGTHLRAALLWRPLEEVVKKATAGQIVAFLPPLESLVRLSVENSRVQMVSVSDADTETPAWGDSSVLLVPRFASELCHAMDWNIEGKYGIFTVCTMVRGSKWKLVPLN